MAGIIAIKGCMRQALWLAALGLAVSWPPAGHAAEVADDVRVMSYNIRYGTAPDGDNHWDRRKAALVEAIREFAPDLLGTQESLAFQRDYIAGQLPEYESLGAGRDDGGDAGEMAALYFRRARFEKLDGGHFWLSQAPDEAGSKGWDSALPRMVTWAKLRDRSSPGKPPLVFINTHFDHEGATARLESARLLRGRIAALVKDSAVVVTGDFNAGEGSPPYAALFGPVERFPSPLVDSYRAVRPQRGACEGTFSGFAASATQGERIDWIGVSRHWLVLQAGIDHTSHEGRTPSDHFAVTAVLRLIPAIDCGCRARTVE